MKSNNEKFLEGLYEASLRSCDAKDAQPKPKMRSIREIVDDAAWKSADETRSLKERAKFATIANTFEPLAGDGKRFYKNIQGIKYRTAEASAFGRRQR